MAHLSQPRNDEGRCGVCGIALIAGPGWSTDLFAAMIAAVEHRGTITERYERGDLAAATRRLPIVDREHAVQPWRFGPASERTLCYNGEIYNLGELRDELVGLGRRPETSSDTELVALSLLQWGEQAVHRLAGEFAFAMERDGSVYVARDQFGVKPLYFTIAGPRVFVASEIKALVPVGTPIDEVPPGHHGWISAAQGARLHAYYDLDEEMRLAEQREFTTEDEAVETIRAAVVAAVETRVRTDLPLGVILSGGLDSTIVATLAARIHSECTAYTIGTPDSPDVAYAARVARDLGIGHRVIELRPRDITRSAALAAVGFSELSEYGDIINAAISAPLFQAIADDGVRVAIGGDCSDELFGGYPMYQTVPADQQRALFAYKLQSLGRTELQRVDRASMAATVEARVPFLDQQVVRAALRVPAEWKTRGGRDKWILRRAFEQLVPDYVINRPKHGLSYSSGLHDRVRLFKPWMPREYRRHGLAAHTPLHRDFDAALAASDDDLRSTLASGRLLQDHTPLEKSRDFVGALRWNLFPPK